MKISKRLDPHFIICRIKLVAKSTSISVLFLNNIHIYHDYYKNIKQILINSCLFPEYIGC